MYEHYILMKFMQREKICCNFISFAIMRNSTAGSNFQAPKRQTRKEKEFNNQKGGTKRVRPGNYKLKVNIG